MSYNDELYEWDSAKEEANIRKQGIDFRTASAVFDDDLRIEWYDTSHSSDIEDRYNTIGMVKDVLFVVYTERHDKIRIISARIATNRERKLYYVSHI